MNEVTVQKIDQVSGRAAQDLDINDIVRLLWRSKIYILCVTVGIGMLAYGVAWIMPPKYSASVLVQPVSQSNRESTLSSALGRFGGLAGLIGIHGLTGQSTAVALATLQSRLLTEAYIKDNGLLSVLYSKKWNARTHTWLVKKPDDVPTLWQANAYFASKIRKVSQNEKNGLVTLTITWTDPVLAARWANGLITMTNDYMRSQAIRRANAEMAYLKAQLKQAKTIEMQDTIYSLMKSDLQNAMVAQGEKQFALRVIDPAVAPEKPTSPVPLLWALAGLLVGGFVSASYVVIRARG